MNQSFYTLKSNLVLIRINELGSYYKKYYLLAYYKSINEDKLRVYIANANILRKATKTVVKLRAMNILKLKAKEKAKFALSRSKRIIKILLRKAKDIKLDNEALENKVK